MTAYQAGRFHVLKMGLGDDVMGQANHALNPSSETIYKRLEGSMIF